jgi:hypothetical protein
MGLSFAELRAARWSEGKRAGRAVGLTAHRVSLLRRPAREFEEVVRALGKVAPSFAEGLMRLAEFS